MENWGSPKAYKNENIKEDGNKQVKQTPEETI